MYDLLEEACVNKIVVTSHIVAILAEIVTDMSISANALRIYCYMASKVGCWQFTNNEIKKVLQIKSDHSISKYIKELIDGGYLVRTEIRNDGMFSGYSYQLTVCQKMTIGKNDKNELKNQQNDRMSKNDNRVIKEEKKKSNIKEKKEEYFNNNIYINNNNNNLKEKINKKENTFFQAKNEVDLEFVRFLDYRKQIKKPYKTQASVDAIYKKFVSWCNGSVQTAKEIVDKTIENQWQGIFEIKNFSNKSRFNFNNKSNNYDVGTKA